MLDATSLTNQAATTEQTMDDPATQAPTDEATLQEEEWEEELIIEDFTIDGICGVY
ncbi:MAG TPA: mycofactocin precursor MftA [Ktedonobacteraceae bacterium]|nr:mycofactocin precursor MftA [Ktedonobacteraceae bacterium]